MEDRDAHKVQFSTTSAGSGGDQVATSRAVARDAERLLANEALATADALELRVALEQLAADRASGESLDSSISRVRDLLVRYERPA